MHPHPQLRTQKPLRLCGRNLIVSILPAALPWPLKSSAIELEIGKHGIRFEWRGDGITYQHYSEVKRWNIPSNADETRALRYLD